MARIRSMKPEYFADEDLASTTSRDARLLYPGLWCLADEHGRVRGNPNFLKGAVFAYDDDLDAAAVDRLVDELIAAGKVVRYRVGNSTYLYLPRLSTHQRLEPEKVPSRLPSPMDSDAHPALPATTVRADESEKFSDESARGADESALMQVAGSKEQVAGSRLQGAVADELFAEFWAAYPSTASKGAARTAWAKAIKKADPRQIIAAAYAYREDPTRTPQYTKHGSTWLNQECWTEERDADGRPLVARPSRASPPGTSVRHGVPVLDRTAEALDLVEHFRHLESQQPEHLAIEGSAA